MFLEFVPDLDIHLVAGSFTVRPRTRFLVVSSAGATAQVNILGEGLTELCQVCDVRMKVGCSNSPPPTTNIV